MIHLMLLCYNNHIRNCAKTYVDAIEQNALSRRVSGLSGGGGTGAIGGGSMVHRLDFELTWGFIRWRWRRMAAVPGTRPRPKVNLRGWQRRNFWRDFERVTLLLVIFSFK